MRPLHLRLSMEVSMASVFSSRNTVETRSLHHPSIMTARKTTFLSTIPALPRSLLQCVYLRICHHTDYMMYLLAPTHSSQMFTKNFFSTVYFNIFCMYRSEQGNWLNCNITIEKVMQFSPKRCLLKSIYYIFQMFLAKFFFSYKNVFLFNKRLFLLYFKAVHSRWRLCKLAASAQLNCPHNFQQYDDLPCPKRKEPLEEFVHTTVPVKTLDLCASRPYQCQHVSGVASFLPWPLFQNHFPITCQVCFGKAGGFKPNFCGRWLVTTPQTCVETHQLSCHLDNGVSWQNYSLCFLHVVNSSRIFTISSEPSDLVALHWDSLAT